MVDCILSYAATKLINMVTPNTDEARAMLDALRGDQRSAQQFLLLTHLYARCDTYTLAWLRATLTRAKCVCGTLYPRGRDFGGGGGGVARLQATSNRDGPSCCSALVLLDRRS
jgi:hypothetical protein